MLARTAVLGRKLQDAMNAQLREELFSAYQYLAMAAWLEQQPLPGASKWMRAQANEELAHAMRFYDHIHDRAGRVDLMTIEKPHAEFGGLLEVFESALAHEQKVTSSILRLFELSVEEKDYVSQPFLQGFLTEQIEEEKTALAVVEMIRLAGPEKGQALFLIDRELAQRGGGK